MLTKEECEVCGEPDQILLGCEHCARMYGECCESDTEGYCCECESRVYAEEEGLEGGYNG